MSVNSIEPLIHSAKEEDLAAANEYANNVHSIKTVKLTRGSHGYGIYIRETVPGEKRENFIPTEQKPSTQLIIDVDEGGPAASAGLQAGDFVLEVNNEDVRKKSHDELLQLIGSFENEVNIKIVHIPKFKVLSLEAKKLKKETQHKISEDTLEPEKTLKTTGLSVERSAAQGSVSPSARRRRIKVLPKCENDELKPSEVFIVSEGNDPNKQPLSALVKVPQPVRLMPVGFDPGEIWERAKLMKERRQESGSSTDEGKAEFLPDQKPTIKDDSEIFETVKDHPYKWDLHQTGEWIKSLGLPDSVVKIFIDNEINGEHLSMIDKNDLQSINILDAVHQDIIIKEIQKVLKKYDRSTQ